MLPPFDSFIYFSIYLVFIFSCRESLLSLTRELRRVMQAALADERGGMGTFLEFACPTCGRREGFASVRLPWTIVYTVIPFQGLI